MLRRIPIIEVIKYLSFIDICNLKCVCKKFYYDLNAMRFDSNLYKQINRIYYGDIFEETIKSFLDDEFSVQTCIFGSKKTKLRTEINLRSGKIFSIVVNNEQHLEALLGIKIIQQDNLDLLKIIDIFIYLNKYIWKAKVNNTLLTKPISEIQFGYQPLAQLWLTCKRNFYNH